MAVNPYSRQLQNPVRPKNEIQELLQLVTVNVESANATLSELESRYKNQLKAQDDVIRAQLKMINEQNAMMDNLQTKLVTLEEHVILPGHISSTLNERLLDDNEQVTRKLNLRIDGIQMFPQDTPERILNYIKREVNARNLDIPDYKYDTAQRVGAKHFKNGKVQQSVVLKMTCATARNKIYINRNQFDFHVQIDLTNTREALLNFARYEIENGLNTIASRVVDNVYADLNGTLNLKARSGRSYGFSSESEFFSLISWLDKEF